jgi:hypothetical protein
VNLIKYSLNSIKKDSTKFIEFSQLFIHRIHRIRLYISAVPSGSFSFRDTSETKDKFAREMKLTHGGFSTEECVLYRQRVRDAAQETVLNLLPIADEQINQTNILMKNRLSTIKNELGLYWEANSGCSAELARTLRSIWACREVQAILKKKDSSFRISTRQ